MSSLFSNGVLTVTPNGTPIFIPVDTASITAASPLTDAQYASVNSRIDYLSNDLALPNDFINNIENFFGGGKGVITDQQETELQQLNAISNTQPGTSLTAAPVMTIADGYFSGTYDENNQIAVPNAQHNALQNWIQAKVHSLAFADTADPLTMLKANVTYVENKAIDVVNAITSAGMYSREVTQTANMGVEPLSSVSAPQIANIPYDSIAAEGIATRNGIGLAIASVVAPPLLEAGEIPASSILGRSGPSFLSSSEFADLSATGTINPNVIRFSQDSIGPTFGPPFGSIDDFVANLTDGSIDPTSISPIRIVDNNGLIQTLDNRRLYSYQQASNLIDLEIPYQKLDNIPSSQLFKFTTQNNGVSVVVRGSSK